jgi:hypothetical protein
MEIRKMGWTDGMEYWIVTTGTKKEKGINGGLSKKGELGMPNMNTIGVSSADKFAKKIQDKGGKVLLPKTAIPGVGWFATCQDTEGNIFGIIEENKRQSNFCQSTFFLYFYAWTSSAWPI